jgi:HK97 family phage portal protein
MLDRVLRWLGLERRSVDYADPALRYLYGDARTASGEPVSVERSVSLTAVWACISLIAGTVASMPLVLYKRGANGARERYTDHPLYGVLHDRPNPAQNVTAFWEAMVTALLLRGNSYAIVSRDEARVTALWFVNPDRVSVDVLKNGKLRYKVAAAGSTTSVSDMLHICGPMSDDGYTGRSVIATFRETLGLGLAQERYGSEFFANAATPRGILTTQARLSETARATLSNSIAEQHASPGRRHRTLLLEEGLTFAPLGVTNDEAQFLESRRFSTEEIARMFLVPPHMIGGDTRGSMTYSNAETQALNLLKHTIGPWLTRIESAVNFACIPPLERRQMYAEYLPDALLMTDTQGRYSAYETGIRSGFLTINEVRRKENLPPLDGVL